MCMQESKYEVDENISGIGDMAMEETVDGRTLGTGSDLLGPGVIGCMTVCATSAHVLHQHCKVSDVRFLNGRSGVSVRV